MENTEVNDMPGLKGAGFRGSFRMWKGSKVSWALFRVQL